jgi:hypothetical protein
LSDYFEIHLDRAPKEGAELALDSIVLAARSIGVTVTGVTVTVHSIAAIGEPQNLN